MAETEALLLRRFAGDGDAEAFSEIIRRHAGLVYGAALRVLADVDRAADVAQETFLQLTKEAANVTDSLPGWLHRVATRKAIDLIRQDASRRTREMRHAREAPHETTDWKEISAYVDAELASLLPELRNVLVSYFLEGHTTREIATAEGVSQATVSRRLDAGVKLLRARLRRRGIIVAVGALSLLLAENTFEAAPAALMAELGKMAIVGGMAAGAPAGTAGTAPTITSVGAGLVAAVKAKAAAIAAIAAIGAGSIATYHYATRTPGSRPIGYVPSASVTGLGKTQAMYAETAPDWGAFLGLGSGADELAGVPVDASVYGRRPAPGSADPCDSPQKRDDRLGADASGESRTDALQPPVDAGTSAADHPGPYGDAARREAAPHGDGEPNDTDPNDTDPNDPSSTVAGR